MVKNTDFLKCQEERKNGSFFKIVQGADISSENMRAIPHDFVRTLSQTDLSRKMKIKARWGRSWEVEISKNPRFYYMVKAGWEKFTRENFLGDTEFLTFTHKGKMRFTLNMYDKYGVEMLQPRQIVPYLASSNRVKTENRQGVYGGVKKEEEVVVSSELSYPEPETAARSNGRGKKIKAEKSQTTSKKTKTKLRFSPGASSSSSVATEFIITIKKSYLNVLAIPKSFSRDYMNEGRTTVKIHDEDMENSWDVVYLSRETSAVCGFLWWLVASEYPINLGNVCKFTVTNPGEMRLDVFKPVRLTR